MDSNPATAQRYRRDYSAESSSVLSVCQRVADRIRTGTGEVHDLGCLPLHHGHHELDGDDRTRTGGLSPDKRALCSSELHPQVAPVGFEPTVSSS
jgi:hypothetical protein